MTINYKKLNRAIKLMMSEMTGNTIGNYASIGNAITKEGCKAQIQVTITTEKDEFLKLRKNFKCIR